MGLLVLASVWVLAGIAIYAPIGWLIARALRAAPAEQQQPVAARGQAPSAAADPPTESVPPPRRAPDMTPTAAQQPPKPAVMPAASSPPPTKPAVVPVAATPPPAKPAAPPASVTRPDVPRHHSHIRIALLAYYGNPMGAFEDDLLRKHVDVVVPEAKYLAHIHDVAPQTPQLLYTNTSSLYFELLTDWLTFADAQGISREAAFYHAAKPTPFRGDSPSSRPVTWFWRVYRGAASLGDVTHLTRPKAPSPLPFAGRGESLYLGHPDRFREINLDLASGAGAGWSAVVEYPTAVDANGQPAAWAALKVLADTTAGLTRSGQITFDPPADWKSAALGGYSRLHYVRFRTTAGGTAPAARSVLGRDYVGASGKTEGTVPVFDANADANGDGYLDDAEYARRAPGCDARFVHESRMPSLNYGQMRLATNPSSPEFRRWAVDYHVRFLSRHPLAGGLFMDNSEGKPALTVANVREPAADFAKDYGAMLGEISKAVAPRWILGNTAGGRAQADAVIRQSPAYFEEFAIRPLANTYLQFEDLAEIVAHRSVLTSPPPYAVIDSLPQRGSPTDERTQLATLAYYYLLADPGSTFLCFFGGSEPGTAWQRHWTPAAAYDVGRPTGRWSRFVEGADPSNPAMKYRVYQRAYERALVVYKPLAFKDGDWKTQAAIGDETATALDLGGTYRPLRADGSLGDPVTRVSLRNGEGAILIRSAP
jgi:hypothetical protein